jgi:hypothetical protein
LAGRYASITSAEKSWATLAPKLKRMQLQLDNIEAEINLAITMRHAELSAWSPGNPMASRQYQNNT